MKLLLLLLCSLSVHAAQVNIFSPLYNDSVTRDKLATGAVANLSVVSKTGNYTLTASDDVVVVNATDGAVTITVPAATQNAGKLLTVKKTDSSSNAVTLSGTIDGVASRKLAAQYDYLSFYSDGTNWNITEDKTTSIVCVTNGNGHGSTNNKIRRYTNIQTNLGSGITYADSAASGGSFTINEPGVYSVNMNDQGSSVYSIGISVNSSTLTTSIASVTWANGYRGSVETPQNNYSASLSRTLYLSASDVVRAHTDGGPNGTGLSSMFCIARVR